MAALAQGGWMRAITAVAVLVATAAVAGCGGSDSGSGPITVYSGREEELVAPLFDRFTEADGHRRRGALRRLGRARRDHRRGGGQLTGRCVLRAGSRLARGRRPATRAAASRDARPRRAAVPRRRRPLGGHVGAGARARLQHRPPERERASGLRARADPPRVEGPRRHRPHERLVPGVRDRDAAVARRGSRRARGSRV